MKITTDFKLNLKTKEAIAEVHQATRKGLLDVTVDITNDTVKGSPKLTGNNMASIEYEMGPGREVATKDLQSAIYSTSGYGGYLETGTVNMAARPYFRPSLDRHIKELPKNIKAHLK